MRFFSRFTQRYVEAFFRWLLALLKLHGWSDTRRPLTKAELATRLSYFLWSAPPDAELRSCDLSKLEVLAGQTNRLLNEMITQVGKKNLAMREFIHALVSSREFHTK